MKLNLAVLFSSRLQEARLPDFEIVFEKMTELLDQDVAAENEGQAIPSIELDELDELRRFAAELQDPEPLFFTTT